MQEAFAQNYVITKNAEEAARLAGYSPNSANAHAHKMVNHPEIAPLIAAHAEKTAKKLDITAEYVLRTIKNTIERCSQATPVLDKKGKQVYVETPDGNVAPAYTFDAAAVLKGTEQLGRHLKLFTDRVEIGLDSNLAEIVADMRRKANIIETQGVKVTDVEELVGRVEAPTVEGPTDN